MGGVTDILSCELKNLIRTHIWLELDLLLYRGRPCCARNKAGKWMTKVLKFWAIGQSNTLTIIIYLYKHILLLLLYLSVIKLNLKNLVSAMCSFQLLIFQPFISF